MHSTISLHLIYVPRSPIITKRNKSIEKEGDLRKIEAAGKEILEHNIEYLKTLSFPVDIIDVVLEVMDSLF